MKEVAPEAAVPGHVVLLGDSIFDNAAYVGGSPDVVSQLRHELDGWQCSLLAVDGDVIAGVQRQLGALPHNATHLVVSVGGNDALGHGSLLQERPETVAHALLLLAAAQGRFAEEYNAMLDAVTAIGLPAAVCTIYDTPPSGPQQHVVKAALCLFNDAITRAAFTRCQAVIDLRLICSEDGDYANPIEPSEQGGRKIAQAIAAFARTSGPSAWPYVVANGKLPPR
ncbi:SGNH/GDSL hydrolase family protein [Arthrobacter sp. MPF02]|uniref:SGNH/GDSL hydrolase family protein n=1 Tax=Arthrobacter sp. MPF02 TaxID=3388492 RepID=UPI00398497EF